MLLLDSLACFFFSHVFAELAAAGANHAEGGWPRDVSVLDPEATQRYRRKVEKDDGYIHCVMGLAGGMDHYVMQNNAIDMYQTYYAELPPSAGVERVGCRTVNVFRDSRPVAGLCWQPDAGSRFAACYGGPAPFCYGGPAPAGPAPTGPAPTGPAHAALDACIWDVENANSPEQVLKPSHALLDLQYNPRDNTVLVGALMSGQVCAWDRRRGPQAVGTCPPHVAHREFVRSVLFINSKSNQEFFSSGPDGNCKWWDLRKFDQPTDEMILDVVKSSFDVQSMANANGVSVLEYEPTIPTRFMAGTENGLVVSGNRKGKTPLEKLPATFSAHLGPVWSLERNPGFLKNFLTVGDWTVRVWSEDCRDSAVMFSPPHRHKITAATWSPTRLSLLLAARWDGVLALWDILRRQHEPALTMQVCGAPLTRLRVQEAGSLVAVGSRDGNVYMVELAQSLTQSDKNDKALLTVMFERESKRERILEARLREIRLKLRQAEDGSPAASATALDPALGDRDLLEAGADFMLQVKKELAAM